MTFRQNHQQLLSGNKHLIMKRIIASIIFCLSVVVAFAQAERITTINGKKYIIHTIEKGHTLYSIAKSYAVDEYFIVQENPGLRDGLKVGQEIKIPLARQSKTESKTAPSLQGEFLYHEVQKKETLYSLSRKYGVEINEIIALNPEVEAGLREGQRLKFPATKSNNTQTEYLTPASAEKMINDVQQYHEVQPKETLYSLAKQYGVTMQDIIDANGGLQDGLKEGTTIVIPKKAGAGKVSPNTPTTPKPSNDNDGTSFFQPQKSPVTPGFSGFNKQVNTNYGTYKVAIMLPFQADELLEKDKIGSNQIALDFYQGVLVALDSLKAQGANIKALVYDTNKDPNRVKTLLNSPAMTDVNLFIGPMYRSVLQPVIEHCEKYGAHVVCPVPQSNKILFNHPNVSKVHTNEITQAALLGKYLATKHPNDNLIVFSKSDADALEKRLEEGFKSMYFKYLPGGNIFGKDTLKTIITNGYNYPEIVGVLDESRTNVIFSPSSDPVMAAGLLTHLKGYSGKYKIKVFGLEKWMSMDKLDSKNKNDLNLTISTGSYVDYNNVLTKEFMKMYRRKFGIDPSSYGYLGFDVAYYYIKGLHEFGLDFLAEFNQQPTFHPTSTKFNLLRMSASSGFENKATYILSFNDYQLQVLD